MERILQVGWSEFNNVHNEDSFGNDRLVPVASVWDEFTTEMIPSWIFGDMSGSTTQITLSNRVLLGAQYITYDIAEREDLVITYYLLNQGEQTSLYDDLYVGELLDSRGVPNVARTVYFSKNTEDDSVVYVIHERRHPVDYAGECPAPACMTVWQVMHENKGILSFEQRSQLVHEITEWVAPLRDKLRCVAELDVFLKQTKVVVGNDGNMQVFPPRSGFAFKPTRGSHWNNWLGNHQNMLILNACILHEGLETDDCVHWMVSVANFQIKCLSKTFCLEGPNPAPIIIDNNPEYPPLRFQSFMKLAGEDSRFAGVETARIEIALKEYSELFMLGYRLDTGVTMPSLYNFLVEKCR